MRIAQGRCCRFGFVAPRVASVILVSEMFDFGNALV